LKKTIDLIAAKGCAVSARQQNGLKNDWSLSMLQIKKTVPKRHPQTKNVSQVYRQDFHFFRKTMA
jgi:hypothetical protein